MANNPKRVYRSDEGFALQLIDPLFNKLALDRSPDVIASPRSEVEVVDLMREASQQGWKVAVRSGGHSWIASSVRSGGLLLDMSAFSSISIDATKRTAKVGPALRSAQLVKALAGEGLAFPAGHCGTPGIGGFLLGGGIGLNWGHWKPACFSVRSVRVVLADGRLVVASESENSELLWLARGSGPGFPGVITEFEIECQTRPADTRVSSWLFDLESLNQVTGWVANASRKLPSNVVVTVSTFGPERPMVPPGEGVPSHLVGVTAIAYVDSEEEAREALNALCEGPGCSPVFQSELDRVPFEMSEADLHASPERASRCFSLANWQRLVDLKRAFDPHGTFHGFPGAGFDKTPSS